MAVICSVVFACIGAALLVLGVVLGWAVFPPLVEENVIKNVVLEENTEQFERWKEVPFPIDFKVYFFVIQNPEEFKNGAKANLTEVGPYVYYQKRWKQNIKRENGELEYEQRLNFSFNDEMSYPLTENDEINIFNVPFNAVIQRVEEMGLTAAIAPFLNDIFLNKTEMVLKTTVKEFLFDGLKICEDGKPTFYCFIIKNMNAKTIHLDTDKKSLRIALFKHKQDSHDGVYRVKTGEENVEDLGKIVLWENKTTIKMWNDTKGMACNMINGTDNTIFRPLLDRSHNLQIYNTDICRSVTTSFEKDVTFKGIKAFRYLATADILPAPYSKPDHYTYCFCLAKTPGTQNDSQCLFDGVQEVYPCFDSHVVLSFPHFLSADKSYRDGVEGMNPDPELHQIFADIEPITGTPLAGGKRVQFSMFVRPIKYISSTEKYTTALIPFIWVDEGLELPDDYVAEINESLFDILLILDIVKWTLIGVGCAVIIISLAMVFYYKRKTIKTV